MRTNNKGVAEAWLNNRAAQSHNGNYHTDGQNLYSYAMLIGRTINGLKIRLDVHGYSNTTTRHMSLAWRADYTIPRVESGGWFYFPDDSLIPDMLYKHVSDIPNTFALVSDSQDTDAIADYLGYSKRSKYSPRFEYGAYFVLIENGDYTRIYAIEGNIPYLDKPVYLVK